LSIKNQKTTPLEAEKDTCRDILKLVIKKSFTKNIKSFHIDSIFQFHTSEKVMTPEREIKEKEFNCLEMNTLPRLRFYAKGEKMVFEIVDTLKFHEKWYHVYSLHFDKNNNLKFFTTYGWAGDGSYAIRLFTMSPDTKKIKDVIYLANIFGDMGSITNTKSKFLNDSIFIQNQEDTFLGKTKLVENSKFLISNSGEIKLLNHQVLMDDRKY
jgi:hypothetical protein